MQKRKPCKSKLFCVFSTLVLLTDTHLKGFVVSDVLFLLFQKMSIRFNCSFFIFMPHYISNRSDINSFCKQHKYP